MSKKKFQENIYWSLWSHIDYVRKKQFLLLIVLMCFAAVFEVFSIGMVIPFLSVLSNPDVAMQQPYILSALDFFQLNPDSLLIIITLIFIGLVLLSGFTRLVLLFFNTKICLQTGSEISAKVFTKVLDQNYTFHTMVNSSSMIDLIANKSNGIIFNVIVPFASFLSSALIIVAIISTLFFVNPLVASVTFIALASIYLLIIYFTKKKIFLYSRQAAKESTNVITCIQESLGGIRDILIDGTQEIYCHIYKGIDASYRRSQAGITFIGSSPKLFVEALSTAFIALLAYELTIHTSNSSNILPVLGAFAIGAQRMIPLFQQSYAGWTNIKGSEQSLTDLLVILDLPNKHVLSEAQILFDNTIILNNVVYSYPNSPHIILKGISLNINRGEKIGIIGATGSGKSTLLDLLMGLLLPNEGFFEIDRVRITEFNNRSWQLKISHVPQAIYLSDTTIRENIAFGVKPDHIDNKLLKSAVTQAQLNQYIQSLPDGLDTLIGERGVRLSGGQRQRIGIARALYKQAEILFLDEATSALDSDTERKIMDSIQSLDKAPTIFMVAHRISTLSSCDRIIELEAGQIKRICQYSDLILSEDAQI